MGYSTI